MQSAATGAADLALAPLLALPALASLLVVSTATALVMVLVARRVSDQPAVVAVKRQIAAALLEIRLFNADPVAVLRAGGAALRHNLRYLWLSLVPVAWLAIPLALALGQLQAIYGYDGLAVGAPALVRLRLAGAVPDEVPIALDAPPAIEQATPAVRLTGGREVLWRIVPRAPGRYTLHVRVGDQVERKALHVGTAVARRSPVRPGPQLAAQLQWPSEPPLPAEGRMAAIEVSYGDAAIDVAGWQVPWLVAYGSLSIAAALVLAPRFGVTL